MAIKGVTIETDMSNFQEMASKLSQFSKRDGKTFMEEQVRGAIRKLMDVTPPSNGKTRGVKAKKLGEAAIASDVRNVFIGTTPKRAEVSSMSEMASIHRSKQKTRSLRVKRVNQKTYASRSMIVQFIKRKQQKVGYLASGWASAARKIGKIRVPGWIGRHNAPGDTVISTNNHLVTANISNFVKWATDVSYVERRAQYAIRWQTRSMNRRLYHYLKKAYKKANA